MLFPTKVVELSPRDNEHIKRLNDPADTGLFHLETWLPFSAVAKLERGNANVRPASERKKPFRDMINTVENSPSTFHRKNRGIIYLCDKFEFDNKSRTLRVTIPDIDPKEFEDLENGEPKFGIADGGHTFEVVQQTIARMNELREREGWAEPFVRVHFLAGQAFESGELEQLVEALNTSSQVQQFTLDEYQNKFDELKEALHKGGFDPSVVAFRENEDKEWDVREIIQRLACFLKERWKTTQPASMYRSKGKALDLYTNEASHDEFKKLYDVAADVVTLPEFIQSEFSKDTGKGRKFGKLRGVKTLRKPQTPAGTTYTTDHQMDLAESLPIAAAFRELLELKGDRYYWKADYKEVFKVASEELYKTLLNKVRTTKAVNTLGADTEYWTQCANIVLRAKYEVLNR
jgi:NTP pyrophosphatase (non-canonical NTP hydrolase)